jgi:hypothetical protein
VAIFSLFLNHLSALKWDTLFAKMERIFQRIPFFNILIYVRFQVFTVMTMKNGVFWDVALVRTDVLEERSASIIRVIRIGELGTKLAVTSNRRTLRRNTK